MAEENSRIAPVTLFTIPKRFSGHTGVIQTNAIMSWIHLVRPAKLVLCGRDAGVQEVAQPIGAQHLKDIKVSEHGTPVVSDAFGQVLAQAATPWVCYLNTDIMLAGDLADAVVGLKPRRPTLIVGQRTDVDIKELIDFNAAEAEHRLRHIAVQHGTLSYANAIDYLCFTPGSWLDEMPPFIVGRPGWDNWFIYNAIRHRVRVIDATADVLAVHQNHGYGHVPQASGHAWEGPEADHNRSQIISHYHYFTINDASHQLIRGRVWRAVALRYLRSRFQRWYPQSWCWRWSLASRRWLRWALGAVKRLLYHVLMFTIWLARYYVLGPIKRSVTGQPPRAGGRPKWSYARSRGLRRSAS